MITIADIKACVQNPALIKDSFFKKANILTDSRGRLINYTGGYTVVIPCNVKGEKWAFRCWHTPVDDAKKRYSRISKAIKKSKLPYFCDFEYIENGVMINGEVQPITKMKWVEGLDLKKYLCKHKNEKEKIIKLADSFLNMVCQLHNQNFAHGDLQHGNILVSETGQLYLVDYDSMYVPEMKNKFPDIIVGLKDYQHPQRKNNKISSEKIDYFSEAIIYTSIIAIAQKPELVEKYKLKDTESLLFTTKDFTNFSNSEIYKELKSLENEDINLCLSIIDSYLSMADINDLQPIERYITSINIDYPSIVPVGENFTITWTTLRAHSVSISEFGEAELNGALEMALTSSKDITFTVTSKSGYQVEKTVNILTAERAQINYFTADKEFTLESVPVKISWECKNAKSIEIMGFGRQFSSGNLVVTPEETTTYKLIVKDDFQTLQKELKIQMLPLPIIESALINHPKIETILDINIPTLEVKGLSSIPNLNTEFINLKIEEIPTLYENGLEINDDVFIKLPKTPQVGLMYKISKLVKSIFPK